MTVSDLTGKPRDTVDYIGDGVYVHYDGYSYWLVTEREEGTHYIALEPKVLDALNRFAKRIIERMNERNETNQ